MKLPGWVKTAKFVGLEISPASLADGTAASNTSAAIAMRTLFVKNIRNLSFCGIGRNLIFRPSHSHLSAGEESSLPAQLPHKPRWSKDRGRHRRWKRTTAFSTEPSLHVRRSAGLLGRNGADDRVSGRLRRGRNGPT